MKQRDSYKLLYKKDKNSIILSDGLSENDRKNIKFIDYNDIKIKNLLENIKNLWQSLNQYKVPV